MPNGGRNAAFLSQELSPSLFGESKTRSRKPVADRKELLISRNLIFVGGPSLFLWSEAVAREQEKDFFPLPFGLSPASGKTLKNPLQREESSPSNSSLDHRRCSQDTTDAVCSLFSLLSETRVETSSLNPGFLGMKPKKRFISKGERRREKTFQRPDLAE